MKVDHTYTLTGGSVFETFQTLVMVDGAGGHLQTTGFDAGRPSIVRGVDTSTAGEIEIGGRIDPSGLPSALSDRITADPVTLTVLEGRRAPKAALRPRAME